MSSVWAFPIVITVTFAHMLSSVFIRLLASNIRIPSKICKLHLHLRSPIIFVRKCPTSAVREMNIPNLIRQNDWEFPMNLSIQWVSPAMSIYVQSRCWFFVLDVIWIRWKVIYTAEVVEKDSTNFFFPQLLYSD